jgi:hypothetical protein
MSGAAAKLVEEFSQLDPTERQEVWRVLQERVKDAGASPSEDSIRSARGMLAGSGLNRALLAERAKERPRWSGLTSRRWFEVRQS